MTTNWTGSFDAFTLRARLYPAFLAVLPVAALVVTLGQQARALSYTPLLVAFGGLFFLADYVRSRGKRLEQALIQKWGGWPTTLYLRSDTIGNQLTVARWRKAIESLTGDPLPTETEERDEPSRSDARYHSATRFLITRVNGKSDVFPRVQEENVHYNFRRNLLALKSIALWIVITCLVLDVAVFVTSRDVLPVAIAAGIHVLALLAWSSTVRPEWVREQGCTYAERLFETFDIEPS